MIKLFPVHGYSTDDIMKDIRFRYNLILMNMQIQNIHATWRVWFVEERIWQADGFVAAVA